jgi:spermidine synthase
MFNIRNKIKQLYIKETKYQKLEILEDKGYLEFYINNEVQWCSSDEFIYHETLVLPYINYISKSKKEINILVLGGGDGFVIRELMKFDKKIKKITLVDIDKEVIELHKNLIYIKKLINNSLNYDKLDIKIEDAYKFIKNTKEKYDLIISDLIDPIKSLSFLYSKKMFKNLKKINNGIIIYQAGDIFYNKYENKKVKKHAKKILKHYKNIYVSIPNFGYYNYILYSKNKEYKKIRKTKFNKLLLKENKYIKSNKILKTIFLYKNIYNKRTKTIKWIQNERKNKSKK